MNRRLQHHPQAGFTILELMVASAIFAVVILVVAVGILRFSQDYFKGITSSNTQAAARDITNDVAQALQLSKSFTTPASSGNTQGFCIDNTMYRYIIGNEVGVQQGSNYLHGLIKETINGGCPSPIPPLPTTSTLPGTEREMLSKNMRLAAFSVSQTGNGSLNIHVRVVYGDDDLLCSPSKNDCASNNNSYSPGAGTPSDLTCESTAGSQFCAVSDLITSVDQRLQ